MRYFVPIEWLTHLETDVESVAFFRFHQMGVVVFATGYNTEFPFLPEDLMVEGSIQAVHSPLRPSLILCNKQGEAQEIICGFSPTVLLN